MSQGDFFRLRGDVLRDEVRDEPDPDNPEREYITSLELEETTVDGNPALIAEVEVKNYSREEDEQGLGYAAYIWVNESLQYVIRMDAHESGDRFLNEWSTILDSFTLLDES